MIRCWWVVLLVAAPLAAGERELDTWVDAISEEVRTARAMEVMREVWETDRWSTFPKYAETARNLSLAMEEAGLREVEIVGAPADGESQFGFWTMPLAWDVSSARLEIVSPEPQAAFRVLADFAEAPASLGMWSGGTPDGGLTLEVVDVGDARAEVIAGMDLEGKLALTSRNAAGLKWALVEAGAAGAINAFTENDELRDDRQWVNAWGDAGWAYTKTSTPLLSFSITPRQTEYLRGLLAQGAVTVHAEVDARHYEGEYPYVMGVVPGSEEGGEEVLTLGHMAEQGAHDNATGVAAMVEGLATLHRLIETGRLPRPKRTIRMIALGELYDTMHYVTENPERVKRTVGAMCLDTPAGPYEMAGTEYTFHMNPDVARAYTDTLIIEVAKSYLGRKGRIWHWAPFMAGTDSFLGEPEIGIPTAWPYSGSGTHSHHNSADTPDTVDARSLHDLTTMTAAFLYALASAEEDEALWLADAGLTRGYAGVLDAYESARGSLAGADDRAAALARGLRRIEYQTAREAQAIRSVGRLAAGVAGRVEALVGRLEAFAEEQRARLREAAGVEPNEAADPRLAEARKVTVVRKRPGTITFDDLPEGEREGWPAAAWWGPAVSALFWSDGERNLAEVIQLTEMEVGPTDFDFLGYFRFLAEKGYVELRR